MTALDTPVLGPDALDAITALCERSLARPLLRSELAGHGAGEVHGDDRARPVADRRLGLADGHSALQVSLHPGGVGLVPPQAPPGGRRRLLPRPFQEWCWQAPITVGADAPYYLFPGVEATEIELLCLLEQHRYQREEANFNMAVDLTQIPDDPGGTDLATTADHDEVAGWMTEHWANWRAEALKALDHGTLLLARDASGITGFCAWDVNRAGLLGPIASRPDLIGRGAGRDLLLGGLHRIRATGATTTEISWVGPIRPYARVGGRISRTFFVYRKRRS